MTFPRLVPLRRLAGCLVASSLLLGCSNSDPRAQARQAEERARASLQSFDAAAHLQKIDPEQVKTVQQELTVLKEYMGPVNGRLDPVTLNALQAFQSSEGLTPDGMFTQRTLDRLKEVARQATPSS